MDENDFYEDDEPIEEVRAAWKRGEQGVTSGPRDLTQRAKSIVDRAVAKWEPATTVEVDGTAWFVSDETRAQLPQETRRSTSHTTTDQLATVHG